MYCVLPLLLYIIKICSKVCIFLVSVMFLSLSLTSYKHWCTFLLWSLIAKSQQSSDYHVAKKNPTFIHNYYKSLYGIQIYALCILTLVFIIKDKIHKGSELKRHKCTRNPMPGFLVHVNQSVQSLDRLGRRGDMRDNSAHSCVNTKCKRTTTIPNRSKLWSYVYWQNRSLNIQIIHMKTFGNITD